MLRDATENEMTNVEVETGTAADADSFVFDTTNQRLWFPTGAGIAADDVVQMIFAADKYSAPDNEYFELLTNGGRPEDVGALRQGQVEIYIYDPDTASEDIVWRLTGCTITSDLTREPLAELGHLGPYDRPLTLPIPITVTIDTIAGDLEHWARIAGQKAGFDADTLDDIDLTDLMQKANLILVVKIYEQTDEEAGYASGTGRKAITLGTNEYFVDGVAANYDGSGTQQERPLKTIVVKNLKITDEAFTLDMGANATQTFGFRANNDLFVVKGEISDSLLSGVTRNT